MDAVIQEYMPGAVDRRKWIERSACAANSLPRYPDADMSLANFEVARYLWRSGDRNNHSFWIHDPVVKFKPAVHLIRRTTSRKKESIAFFMDVFADDVLTESKPLNEKVAKGVGCNASSLEGPGVRSYEFVRVSQDSFGGTLFFERMPSFALPGQHGLLVAFDDSALRLW